MADKAIEGGGIAAAVGIFFFFFFAREMRSLLPGKPKEDLLPPPSAQEIGVKKT